jgi:hypothetical protein
MAPTAPLPEQEKWRKQWSQEQQDLVAKAMAISGTGPGGTNSLGVVEVLAVQQRQVQLMQAQVSEGSGRYSEAYITNNTHHHDISPPHPSDAYTHCV